MHASGDLTVRIAYNLFTRKPKGELADFRRWTGMLKPRQGDDFLRHNGAGEMLVYFAADFEEFLEPRPDLAPVMEQELKSVVEVLAPNRWRFRLHATYDESISRALDVSESVNRAVLLRGLHWLIDYAETISPQNIDRIASLVGGIAIQHRMAYQGEYFRDGYGKTTTRHSPPVRQMLQAGLPVGAGTDATASQATTHPYLFIGWLRELQEREFERVEDMLLR